MPEEFEGLHALGGAGKGDEKWRGGGIFGLRVCAWEEIGQPSTSTEKIEVDAEVRSFGNDGADFALKSGVDHGYPRRRLESDRRALECFYINALSLQGPCIQTKPGRNYELG